MITQEAARLDWKVFSARFYPDRRRHDLEAIVAYDAYRNRVEEAERGTPLSAAVQSWEGEGGSV
jgi:hypothetical protein